eukprot:CAMPEP_0114551652 /NCGR_PEP_ID=MMETSP0114-20121206/6717_1 /TAXON_ID=31324 /ORGANISM="Goniomonas sp, Strain m" /LENGTH=103 /DNA_ID=CAMNT_0001736499 /DNA_START=91 /DNA_END=400 /DNA_ORIENTATION=+
MSVARMGASLMQPAQQPPIVPQRLSPKIERQEESGSGQGLNHSAPKQVDCPHLRNVPTPERGGNDHTRTQENHDLLPTSRGKKQVREASKCEDIDQDRMEPGI